MSDRFRNIAPILDQLKPDANARMFYELMSDSLMWSDEYPVPSDGEPLGPNCLRGVFRFRTTLILGKPEEKFRPGWEELQDLCPNWPGFLPERRAPDPAKTRFFEERRERAIAEFDALDEEFERQRQKKRAAETV